ncbi:hypothetical protein Q4R69_18065 [Morganella morganii subsp. sibonii]
MSIQSLASGNDKYDGNYVCDLDKSFNNRALEDGLKYSFPKETKMVNVSVNNRHITIYGMKSGDYKTGVSSEVKDPVDGDILTHKGKELEVVFYHKDNEFRFAPYDGGLQILENCK